MLKKLLPALLCIMICTSASAQYHNMDCPKFYVGLSTGFNNQSGLIGPNFDIPLVKRLSFGFGVGRSSWGWKMYSEARGYLGECNRKLAVGAGMSYNTGIQNYSTVLPTTVGDAEVKFVCKPSLNAFASVYYFFNIGHDWSHRFYLQTGYSYRLYDNLYTAESKYTLTSEGETVMRLLQPGGVIFALGFSFGF
ncbi:MAG: hypothetical protein KDC07_11605 [Chitinophagaceae bacterium]|nr:hypothetical protein [Chitinophagaceae bacterium]MCB9045328.1 hypothetical protein [Chitinophagales bacterium]